MKQRPIGLAPSFLVDTTHLATVTVTVVPVAAAIILALASAGCRVNSAIGTEPVAGAGTGGKPSGAGTGGQIAGSGGSPGSGGATSVSDGGSPPDGPSPSGTGGTPVAGGTGGASTSAGTGGASTSTGTGGASTSAGTGGGAGATGGGPPAAPATFGSVVNVGTDPSATDVMDFNLNVAMSNNGTGFLTYYDNTGVWARRYTSGMFDSKTLISQAGTTANYDPVIVADDQGNAMLAWSAVGDLVSTWGTIAARHFTASGGWPGGWGATETLRTGTSVSDVQRVLGASMTPRGHAAVLWNTNGLGTTYFRLYEAGHGWDALQTLPPDASDPTFAPVYETAIADVGQHARAVIARSGASLQARTYDYDPSSHTGVMGAPSTLFTAATGFQTVLTSMVIDLAGNVTTGFVQRVSPGFEMSSGYVGRYAGGAWQAPAVGLTPAIETPQPIVAVNRAGDGIVVWVHRSTVDMTVPCDLHARLLQGGVWQPESTIATPGVLIESPSAAIDGNGRAIVFWTQVDSSTSSSIRARTIGPSTTWSAPQTLSAGPNVVTGYQVSTAVDDDGAGLAAWLEIDPAAGSSATYARATAFHL